MDGCPQKAEVLRCVTQDKKIKLLKTKDTSMTNTKKGLNNKGPSMKKTRFYEPESERKPEQDHDSRGNSGHHFDAVDNSC
jgi:hypothetical protein